MPPSTRLASASRNSQSSRIFKNAFTAEGLKRFRTSLLERSAGFSQAMPAGSRLRVAILCSQISPDMEHYTSIIGTMQLASFESRSHFSLGWLIRRLTRRPSQNQLRTFSRLFPADRSKNVACFKGARLYRRHGMLESRTILRMQREACGRGKSSSLAAEAARQA